MVLPWYTIYIYAHLLTLPVYCNHFTLGNPKKSFYNSIIHTGFRLLRYLRRNKLKLLYCCTNGTVP